MGFSRRLARGLQRLVPRGDTGGHVLAYHLVGGGSQLVVDLSLPTFERQMQELRNETRPTSLAELWGSRAQRSSTPSVAVTFDDAFDNFRQIAWPQLAKLEIPVTLFVPVAFVEGSLGSPFDDAWTGDPMSWSDLRDLAANDLLSIGSHSWHHADLRALGDRELRDDLLRSRRILEDRLGLAVHVFCYPRGQWNGRVESVVREVYEMAVIGGGRRVSARSSDPFRVERTSLRNDMPDTLSGFLQREVCVEEWAADQVRRRIRR